MYNLGVARGPLPITVESEDSSESPTKNVKILAVAVEGPGGYS